MNDSLMNNSGGKFPSDEQMDGLLRGFFQQEVPAALDRPFRRPAMITEPVSVQIVAQSELPKRTPRNGQLIVASAISILAMTLVVAFTSQSQQPSGGFSNNRPEQPVEASEQLMLVSPQGDSDKSNHAVGEDGVTQQELEIEVSPKE